MDVSAIEHPSITAENRPAFETHMEKFETMEDAALDGMALKKMTGVAVKLPESLDNLPDDAARADLSSKVNKLYGRTYAGDLAELADMDLKAGSASPDKPIDENFAKQFKQWIVDEKIEKGTAQKAIAFFNKAVGQAQADYTTKAVEERLAAVTSCTEALIKHADFGSKEKLDAETVRLHRALINNTGCSADEAADVADFLKDREGATNPTIRRLMISNLAPLATESSTVGGGGQHGVGDPGAEPKSDQDKQMEEDMWPGQK